jgi:TPR repeat protein/signal transduction histidine kinase
MTEQNTLSISELEQKANAGDAQAQFDLAARYVEGSDDLEESVELALMWLTKSAEQGHSLGQFALGINYLKRTEKMGLFSKEMKNFRLFNPFYTGEHLLYAVEHLPLRLLYLDWGDDLPFDAIPSFTWLKNAAQQNCREAQYTLALCYQFGIGIAQNEALAFEWFTQAAKQGHVLAIFILWECYGYGTREIRRNPEKELAFGWFTKKVAYGSEFYTQAEFYTQRYLAFESEHPDLACKSKFCTQADLAFDVCFNISGESCFNLAKCYFEGKGVEKNDKLGLQWLVVASKFGNKRAFEDSLKLIDELAERLHKNNYDLDILLNELAHTGSAEAQYKYALYYFEGKFEGKGDDVELEFALRWLTESIQQNHAEACQWLENTYLNFVFPYFSGREDIDQCYKFAFEWLLNGHGQTHYDFEINFGLAVLYAFGKGIEKNQELAIKHFESCSYECHRIHGYEISENFTEIFYNFSDLYKNLSEKSAEKYYFKVLAPFFWEGKSITRNTKQSYSVLPSLRVAFHLKMGEFELLKAFFNSFEQLESSFNYPSSKKSFIDMGLTVTEQAEDIVRKNQELEEKNRALQEKEKDLEDMMSMFAHKFRSPLDAIMYNTNHENIPKLYAEAAQTMRGLLDIFSTISTDDTILPAKIKADCQGNARLMTVLSKTLNMMLLHLLSASGTEKIHQHYLAYAKAHGKVAASVTDKEWYDEHFELEQALQAEWEQDFAALLSQSAPLAERLAWLEQHFFKLELIGFDRDDIQFKEYAVTESLLTILLNEILVNAFKYYSSETQQAVILEWSERDGKQILSCRNPSVRRERTTIKGSGKGHTFLSALARKIGGQFSKPKPQDDFVLEFGIPNELLMANPTGEQ